jgi:hypothetical protein
MSRFLNLSGWARRFLGVEKRLRTLREGQTRQMAWMDEWVRCQASFLRERPATTVVMPELSCGLGNQLFQIAAAHALARRTSSTLALNHSIYAWTSQGYESARYRQTLYQKIPETEVVPGYRFEYFGDDYLPLPPLGHARLGGYFQSEKYFEACGEEVRGLFVFPEAALAEAREFLGRDPRPVVGVHVRRGDYKGDPMRDLCTPCYFRRAMARFPRGRVRFVLCSDEPAQAREWIGRQDVEIFAGRDELSDLALLAHGRHLILSNSSFSWWAAFLGPAKETVIAPDRWLLRDGKPTGQDIYRKDWIRVRTRPGLFR